MKITPRGVACLATYAAAATLLVTVPAAAADSAARSEIGVRVAGGEHDVDSGEQFALRGRMTSLGEPVAGAPVRVQTYRDGAWEPVRGAVVTTDAEGRYRVRVILVQDGDRDLRVVANPPGDDIRTARAYTVVRVWR